MSTSKFRHSIHTDGWILSAQFERDGGQILCRGLVHHAPHVHRAREEDVVPVRLEQLRDHLRAALRLNRNASIIQVSIVR